MANPVPGMYPGYIMVVATCPKRKITLNDVKDNTHHFDGWFHQDEAIKHLQKGDLLLGIKIEDKYVFYQWFEYGTAHLKRLSISFDPPKGVIHMACMYTVPEFRGRGIATNSKPHSILKIHEEGYKAVFGMIPPRNVKSHAVNRKAGARKYQNVVYKRILFIKYYKVSHGKESKVFLKIGKKGDDIWRCYFPWKLIENENK